MSVRRYLMFTLDYIHTVAFGGLGLFIGHGVKQALPWLPRDNVPATG